MMRRAAIFGALAFGVFCGGCEWMPGRPTKADDYVAPGDVVDFGKLYSQNCRGCHGHGGEPAGSIALDNPTYLAVVPEDVLRAVIANGVPGTAMPAFSQDNGGTLNDKQIDVLVSGIKAWARPGSAPAGLPPYAGALGDPAAGAEVFSIFCASCHGADGRGVKDMAGSVIDPAYLGLTSNQYLRTIVIAGRNDLGCPDFASRIPGRPMTESQIADVVAWLASNRKNEFGQPLAAPKP